MIDAVYSAKVLSLAANMPHAGRLPEAVRQGVSERTARLCGSRVVVDVALDAAGRVADFAQDVQACALGQAAAGVLGAHVLGATRDEVVAGREGLRAMLKDGAPPPVGRFADLALLQAVKDYPARHASTMLAFEAAAEAIARAEAAILAERTPTAAVG